jgi:hypothetical protein
MKPRPQLFWRYRPVQDIGRDREIFVEDKLWFSTPDQFNDPFEASPHVRWHGDYCPSYETLWKGSLDLEPSMSPEDRHQAVTAAVEQYRSDPASRQRNRESMGPALRQLFQRTSIGCFFGADPETALSMWAYYASGHQGYCLGFSFAQPWSYTDPESGKSMPIEPFEVDYSESNEYPVIAGDVDLTDGSSVTDLLKMSLLTKSKVWMHEEEWRCLRFITPSSHQSFPPTALRTVIFGAYMDAQRRADILAMLGPKPYMPEVYDASVADEDYRLVLTPTLHVHRSWR